MFLWDKMNRGWGKQVNSIMTSIGLEEHFLNNYQVDIREANMLLHEQECNLWSQDVLNMPKLRTYVTFKQSYGTEPYVKYNQNRGYQISYGSVPLWNPATKYRDRTFYVYSP